VGGEIAFYKQTLIENYDLLFNITGTEMLDKNEYIANRIRLLNTILMDEKMLNILLGHYNATNESYSSFYYLLNNISNDEEDKRKLNEILNKAKENTEKIKLLEDIVSKAEELISSITKEEKRKTLTKKLIEKQADIEDKKEYILKHITNDYNETKIVENAEYLILKKKEKEEYSRDTKSKTIYYLLYKDQKIYTMKTEWWSNGGDRPITPPELLDYDIDFNYYNLLSKLYDELKLKSGGKRIAPAYKLNGEKVSLLINKKKLHRSVYVKGNGNGKAKYCKISNEFVLLSKLKNKII